MLKKFFIAVGSLLAVLVIACSNGGVEDVAGGTIDPSTIALNSCSSGDAGALSSSLSETENGVSVSEPSSSSSESDSKMVQDESSSSGNENNIKPIFRSSSSERPVIESSSDEGENKVVDPIPVSSSSELRDGDIAHASDFSIQCVENVIYVKLDTPAAASDVSGPKAFKHVEGDSVKFVLQNVYFAIPCEEDAQKQFLQGVNEGHPVVSSEGDTLYVAFSRSKGWDYGCECAAKATFTLGKAYSGINYMAFDQKETLPVKDN
ncbi:MULTISPECIES: hypothetical protein [unclassified Fibrobacter]|uniref:hypothetical protein n=1 Tax=unclassified Fibrobacter TaxID=2634177 RepID=UPI0025C4F881|nr:MULTISPECIES: hypothetical protein [unclassified Fibrobacter]